MTNESPFTNPQAPHVEVQPPHPGDAFTHAVGKYADQLIAGGFTTAHDTGETQ